MIEIPLVSVVTTVYNCKEYIEESLESIIKQTYKDFHLIVYDDGSTDGTKTLVDKILSQSGIKYIVFSSNVNRGVGFGRNKAVAYAQGDYIAIHDGDDISLPDRLEKQVDFFEKDGNIFCLGGRALKIDEKGEDIGEIEPSPIDHNSIKQSIIEIVHKNPIIDPTTMFVKSIFKELNGYNEKNRLTPDFELWTKAMVLGYKFSNLPEFLTKYRVNPDGNTIKYKIEMIRSHVGVRNKFLEGMKNKLCL